MNHPHDEDWDPLEQEQVGDMPLDASSQVREGLVPGKRADRGGKPAAPNV